MKATRGKYANEPREPKPDGDTYPVNFWCANCGHLIEFLWRVGKEMPESSICPRCQCFTFTTEMQEEKN